eukprot:scaffold38353_cov31-Tisochrysis_lutea.AAC.8
MMRGRPDRQLGAIAWAYGGRGKLAGGQDLGPDDERWDGTEHSAVCGSTGTRVRSERIANIMARKALEIGRWDEAGG